VTYSAPAAIFVDQPRHYGAVPAIGGHGSAAEPARARSKTS
jgi:itaconate CoA-transferase